MRTPPYTLPTPAEVLLFDFRPPLDQRPAYPVDRPVKLVQWNIERGYKLDAVIEVLRSLDADVLALQEIDIHCERSDWADTGQEIAKALGLAYAFVCEFEELHSPLRAADTQGGGVHGNAILSKYDIVDARAVEHTTHPVDWELPPERQPHPLARKEPRHGRRLTAAATVVTPQGPLLVYSAHLECFCGALARMAQVSDIFRDTRQYDQAATRPANTTTATTTTAAATATGPTPAQKQSQQDPDQEPIPQQQQLQPAADGPPAATEPLAPPPAAAPSAVCPAVLMGDLNTLANGVARLSPNYCTDHLRWGSLGWFEAELLDKRVLAVKDPAPLNTWARRQGLSEQVCQDLVNPGYAASQLKPSSETAGRLPFDYRPAVAACLPQQAAGASSGCANPFDSRNDITFDHYKYRWLGLSFMTGKLDWVLLRGCRVVSKRMGNADYTASDHKWLQVEVMLEQPSIQQQRT